MSPNNSWAAEPHERHDSAQLSDPGHPDGSSAAVEDLTVPPAQRSDGALATQQRLRGLLVASCSIAGELSLLEVPQRLVDAARHIAGARHAWLGVLAPDGSVQSLVHAGLDDQLLARVRALPPAPEPLEASAVPTQAGISSGPRPPGPTAGSAEPATSLGVPVRADGSLFGHLHVAEPVGGSFTAEDRDLVGSLAATAGIAVQNARRHEESRRRQEWLLASSEVSQRLLAADDDQLEVWRLIVANVRDLADADLAALAVPLGEDETYLRVVVASGAGEQELAGRVYPIENGGVACVALRQGRSAVASSGQDRAPGLLGGPGEAVGPMMALPLTGERGLRRAILVCRRPAAASFTPAEVTMAGDFVGQAVIALELADARLAQQRVGALEDRERIARDLHDHVIQRLFATGLSLRSTARTVDGTAVQQRLGRSVQELDETVRQIRTSIFALKYSRPTASSLRATVLAVVEEAVPTLGFRPSTRFAGPLDSFADADLVSDVGAVLQEWLTDVARHSGAHRASVAVQADGRNLSVVVSDDGRSKQDIRRRSALADLRGRAQRYGGALTVEPSGEGLRLTWSIPMTGPRRTAAPTRI